MTQQKTSSIRTPVGRARGLGSARDGVHHWLMSRISAIAIIPAGLYLMSCLDCLVAPDYAAFVSWMSLPFTAIAMLVFIVASFHHACLGVQVVIEDYVHSEGRKVVLLLLSRLFFFFLGFACVYAVIYINFGLYG